MSYEPLKVIDYTNILLFSQDHDNDSKVSMEDFRTTVLEERLLIEAFGPCLPDDNLLEVFSAKILQLCS